jgi:hypothetical protein
MMILNCQNFYQNYQDKLLVAGYWLLVGQWVSGTDIVDWLIS